MKKSWSLSFLLLFGLMLAVSSASAGTVNMYYIGPEGNQSGGVYTYPYQFHINGSSTVANLLCDSFNNEISPGDHWTATVLNMVNLNATTVLSLEFPSAGVGGYLEAAYLFKEQLADPNNTLYNWAVWDIFAGDVSDGSSLSAGDKATVDGYLAGAVAQYTGGHLSPAQFANMVIYTPTDISPNGPQEFFGTTTPEPASLALFGSGLLGVAGVLRRNMKAQR